jgi:predicted solute-binding protein
MARESELERVRCIDFAGARDEALEHVEEIASVYSRLIGLPPAEIRLYLLENISYDLDEELRAGLDLFYRLAYKHRIMTHSRPLKMIDA